MRLVVERHGAGASLLLVNIAVDFQELHDGELERPTDEDLWYYDGDDELSDFLCEHIRVAHEQPREPYLLGLSMSVALWSLMPRGHAAVRFGDYGTLDEATAAGDEEDQAGLGDEEKEVGVGQAVAVQEAIDDMECETRLG
jgi:hypothetical protein